MSTNELHSEAKKLLEQYPETEVIELLLPDMNGILRGKQVPAKSLGKLFTKGINIGGASNIMLTNGEASETIPDGSQDGDPDMVCRPVEGSLSPVPWAPRPTAQMLMSMYERDGSPYYADPRHVLGNALKSLTDMGLTPVVALELEFYLLDASTMPPKPAEAPVDFPTMKGGHCYNLDAVYDYHQIIHEIEDACKAQNIPMTSALAEYGDGQFEVNLNHTNDIMAACDQAVLLKRAVRGVARRHNLLASFMAKPFAEDVGSGLHIHMSLLDDNGKNVFDGGGKDTPYSDKLIHAVGGLCEAMAESTAIFAPNANSYRRFQPGSYVPLTPNWGPNHRGVSVRIPLSDPEDTRFEHRVASADANPYLVAASVIAGAHHGMINKISPPPMVQEGEVFEEVITLPTRWEAALDVYDTSIILPTYLGEKYAKVFGALRREEANRFHSEISDRDYAWYLRTM
jgi:glutamine synthetase